MRVIQSLLFLVAVLCVLGLGILMGIDNSEPVRLAFVDWRSPALPIFVWVAGALIVGVLLGALLTRMGGMGQRRALNRANRALHARDERPGDG